jgi:arginase family enzyme
LAQFGTEIDFMQLLLLHLDGALESQPDFIQVSDRVGARHIRLQKDAKRVRLWGYHAELAALQEKLAQSINGSAQPRLTFMGSGDFHHMTALLLNSALESHPGPVTVIHIDNHPDWANFGKGIHCGSWINRALDQPKVKKLITLGVTSRDLVLPEPRLANLPLLTQGLLELYPYDHPPSQVSNEYGAGASFEQKNGHLHWKTIRSIGEQNFIDLLLSRIETEVVYITIDKDVLDRDDAISNWKQGQMRLPYLLSIIKEIGARHTVIGADVIGDYSKRSFSGTPRSWLSKRYETRKKSSFPGIDAKQVTAINTAANLSLLDTLSAVMN